jgi:hypothetical protein
MYVKNLENRYFVYCIINLTNNKKYIGKTRNITKRWYDYEKAYNHFISGKHKFCSNACSYKYNQLIEKAICKYTIENFRFEILEEFSDGKRVFYI